MLWRTIRTVIETAKSMGGALLTLALLASASFAAGWSPEQKEVIAMLEQWQRAWDNGDMDTLDKLLPDKIDMDAYLFKRWDPAKLGVFTDKVTLLKAYAQWREWMRNDPWDVRRGMNFKITIRDVKVSGNEATVTRKLDYWTTAERGRKVESGTVIKRTCLRKINADGTTCPNCWWKLSSDKYEK